MCISASIPFAKTPVQWLAEQPDLSLAELAERLEQGLQIRISVPRLDKVLQAMRLPRKSRSTLASARTLRVTLARAAYRKDIAPLPKVRFKFVDESGVNISMTRLLDRAVHGKQVADAALKKRNRDDYPRKCPWLVRPLRLCLTVR